MADEVANSSARTRLTAQARYNQLKTERNPYLDRARRCSKLTIPALIPESGETGSDELYQPFQSLGSRGVNHLAAKLMLALFPPNQPFFELTMEEYVLEALEDESGQNFAQERAEIERALGRVERTILTRLEHTGARPTLNEVLKHLLVGGNALVFVQEDASLKMYPLSKYVVKRDKSDNVLEIVVKDVVSRTSLPEEAESIIETNDSLEKSDRDPEKNLDIYTRIRKVDGKWHVVQEIKETEIPGTEGTYPLEKSPWLPLRLIKVDGEDYGRSFVEEYLGDLRSAEGLNEAIVKVAVISAKILIFVDDNGLVTVNKVRDAESGQALRGRAEDLSVFQVEKFGDYQVARDLLERIETRLEQAFLLFSGVQRDAERVTAEEIRAVVQELEQGLGGVYSVLADELQLPLVRRVMHQMTEAEELPELPDDAVAPEITTGIDALGRTSDLRKLDLWIRGVGEALGPEVITRYISPRQYMTMRANALGLDVEGLVKSEEQIQAETQQALQAQIAQDVAPEAAKQQIQQNNNTNPE